MASIKDHVQTALDEARMLLLASQVFFGFEFRAVFEPGFTRLPPYMQHLKVAALGLMIVMIAGLVMNAAWHRIVEGGEDRRAVVRVATLTIEPALIALTLVLAIDVYVATHEVLGRGFGVVAAALTIGVCVAAFQGVRFVTRKHGHREHEMKSPSEDTEQQAATKDKIRHLLTETRVVIPGAQALLGFQFSIILMESFQQLDDFSRRVHLFAIGCTALAIILFIAPAAYHRIVEKGALTEHFHRIGSRFVVVGLVPLTLGLSADVYVAVHHALHDHGFAVGAALATLALCTGLWFGVTSVARLARGHRSGLRKQQPA